MRQKLEQIKRALEKCGAPVIIPIYIQQEYQERRMRKEQKKFFEEIVPENFWNLMININLHIRKLSAPPVRGNQRDPHGDNL